MIAKPTPEEFAPYYTTYISKVPEAGPLPTLQAQRAEIEALAALPDDRATFRYAPGKWSVNEVLGHLADAERVFAYRLLRIARNDSTPLSGFDENQWAEVAPHHFRPVAEVVGELLAVRAASLALVASLDAVALTRQTVANNRPVSARAICWIMAGHTQHHLELLHQRYGV